MRAEHESRVEGCAAIMRPAQRLNVGLAIRGREAEAHSPRGYSQARGPTDQAIARVRGGSVEKSDNFLEFLSDGGPISALTHAACVAFRERSIIER